MHLDRRSPFAVFNHSNWRQKTERIARPSAPEELVLLCLDAFLVD